MGIATVGPVGVHNGNGLGQGFLALMVICDHQIHSQLPAQFRFLHSGDTAVHGDDELYAFLMELMQGNGVQTVALLQPAGDVADAVRAVTAQKIRQKAGGGNAIYVIVAENGDFFSIFHGKGYPPGGKRHVRHQKRVQKRGIAVQILFCLTPVFDSPAGQHHGGKRRVARSHQRIDGSHIRLLHIPNSVFHLSTHPVTIFFLIL